jgi:hypoxanthine phosphoribosyltransferase
MAEKTIPQEFLGDTLVSKATIIAREKALAEKIQKDLAGRHPILLCVKEGARFFFDDLCALLEAAEYPFQRAYVKTSSYAGNLSSGKVMIEGYRGPSVYGRTVVIVEDIIDTALTVKALAHHLREQGAVRVETCVLLFKKRPMNLLWRMTGLRKRFGYPRIRYVGSFIDNHFVVGKGLDYDDYGRTHEAVYKLMTKGQEWVDQQNKKA